MSQRSLLKYKKIGVIIKRPTPCTSEVPSNLIEPYDCWLSKEPEDCHVLFLADKESGKTWVALNLRPPLTGQWCAVKSGQRLWATGNRFENRCAVLTGYFLSHYSDGNYDVENFIDEKTTDIDGFRPTT